MKYLPPSRLSSPSKSEHLTSSPLHSTKPLLSLLLSALLLYSPDTARAQNQTAPSKAQLIEQLETTYALLEKGDYPAASKYFILPPNFTPDMLAAIIQRKELSLPGILVLEKGAKFGKASILFGNEKAAALAKRASVDVTQCYGFYHQTPQATAEVLALWQDGAFKFVRLDDVGKLQSTASAKAPSNQADPAKAAARLPELEAAVQANPKDASKRATYAMVLYQTGNYPAAWQQLRIAHQQDPKHGGIAKGMAQVFAKFSREGLFTVGTPKETLIALLGKPDKEAELTADKQRLLYAFWAIDLKKGGVHEIIDLRGVTQATFQPSETIAVTLDDRNWHCSFRTRNRISGSAIYTPLGETPQQWNEQVEIQRYIGGAKNGSIKKLSQIMIQQIEQRRPGLTHRILDENENSLIASLAYPANQAGKRQHELIRLFLGKEDLHRLSYRIVTEQPSQETQKKWLAIFKSSKLNPAKRAK